MPEDQAGVSYRYVATRAWSTDLEPGTWYEICYDDARRLIAGFVFVPPSGITEAQNRDVLGHVIKAGFEQSKWATAISLRCVGG